MAIEVKVRQESKRPDLTSAEFYFQEGSHQAEKFLTQAQAAGIIDLKPEVKIQVAALVLLKSQLTEVLTAKIVDQMLEKITIWQPLTTLAASDAIRYQQIQQALQKAKELANQKTQENIQTIFKNPNSRLTKKLLEESNKLAQALISAAFHQN